MPKVRDQQQYTELRESIKATARQHMAADGTAALSLRAIARDLNLTAPALYRYFASRNDLITALVLDAYNALADALQAASQRQPDVDVATRLYAVLLGYRDWALAHPIDFTLIYGNPIPGYEAPREPSVAAARRGLVFIVGLLQDTLNSGLLHPQPEYAHLPPTVEAYLSEMAEAADIDADPLVLYLATVGWTRIHGIIMLELFTHIQPVIGDSEAFYRFEILHLLRSLGLTPQPID